MFQYYAKRIEEINMAKTERGKILEQGINLTEGDRDATYGDPNINLQCQWELWRVYDRYCRLCTPGHMAAHQAAMQHVLAKISRIACGPAGHTDNYIDGATYLAIASEVDNIDEIDMEVSIKQTQ